MPFEGFFLYFFYSSHDPKMVPCTTVIHHHNHLICHKNLKLKRIEYLVLGRCRMSAPISTVVAPDLRDCGPRNPQLLDR